MKDRPMKGSIKAGWAIAACGVAILLAVGIAGLMIPAESVPRSGGWVITMSAFAGILLSAGGFAIVIASQGSQGRI